MLNFMLAVMASNVFWVVYSIVSLIVTVTMMRAWFKTEIKIATGKKDDPEDGTMGAATIAFFVFMILWPVILAVFLIIEFAKVFGKMAFLLVRSILAGGDKLIPKFSIKINKK